MNRGRIKIVPSRLMVVGLGTTVFGLCLAAIIILLPGLTSRARLAERVVGSLQVLSELDSEQARAENLDRILFSILQSSKANRNISYLRFIDLKNNFTFTFDDDGGGTKLSIVHEGMSKEGLESSERHWNEFLDALDGHVC